MLYIVYFCFNGLCFLVLVRFIESMFTTGINLQFYFLIFSLLILISKLHSSCKMSWGVLALLLFCRLNKDIISFLKLCYNSCIKLSKPVVRRNYCFNFFNVYRNILSFCFFLHLVTYNILLEMYLFCLNFQIYWH